MMLRLLLTSSSTLPSAPLHNRGWHISASAVDLQRDCGRGQEHLSARLEEGDVCVYQVGTWMVDNVPVGPGDPPRLLLARVDCLQINWTTDCEHGRILATAVSRRDGDALRIDEDVEFAGIEVADRHSNLGHPCTDLQIGLTLCPHRALSVADRHSNPQRNHLQIG